MPRDRLSAAMALPSLPRRQGNLALFEYFDRRPNQHNFPGLFWLSTTRKSVVCESLLKRDRLWHADFDPDITDKATQRLHHDGSRNIGLLDQGAARNRCETR